MQAAGEIREATWRRRFSRLGEEEGMKRTLLFAVMVFCLGLSQTGFGEEKKEVKKNWSDEAQFSFVDTGGNTEVTSLAGKNLLKYKFSEEFLASWVVSALYGKTDGEKTAERYATELRLDYAFSGQMYAYGIAGWMKDEFAGFDSRYYVGPGVGYKLFTGPQHFLLGEAGLNYTKDEYVDGTDDNYLEGRLFGKYEFAFTEKNRFSQSVEFLQDLSDSDNYKINSETAIISALSDFLSLKASYVINYNNSPRPSTLDDTDTILAVSLVVNF